MITNPKKEKSKKIAQTITCKHLSTLLRTKNLYITFDDENGIGDVPYLMNQVLMGTDWTFDEEGSDVFLENHGEGAGEKVKKRSLKSDSKEGAYKLIGDICDLFNAYPVFDAVHKTVRLHDLNNKLPMREMIVGVNLSAMTVEYDSSNIVTRLYVEGDYDDDGAYIGIENVPDNKFGLNYLMNFDYYRSIGAFTEQHEQALAEYLEKITDLREKSYEQIAGYSQMSADLTSLWGTQNYVLWTVKDQVRNTRIVGGKNTVEESRLAFDIGDKMYVFWHDDSLSVNQDRYQIVDVTIDTSYTFDREHYPFIGGGYVTHVMKWITGCSGSIGAKEAAI